MLKINTTCKWHNPPLSKQLPLRIGTKGDSPNDKEEVLQQSTIQENRPTSSLQSLGDVIGNAGETLGIVQLSESIARNSKQLMNETEEESFEIEIMRLLKHCKPMMIIMKRRKRRRRIYQKQFMKCAFCQKMNIQKLNNAERIQLNYMKLRI